MDALLGGVQQLQPGLGQWLGGRAASCRWQVLRDAFHKDKPGESGKVARCGVRSLDPLLPPCSPAGGTATSVALGPSPGEGAVGAASLNWAEEA